MAKSKKYLKKKAKSKGKRKIHNTRKKVRHDKNYIHINNTVSTNVMYTQGNRPPKKTTFKWDGKYDGKNANIHMDLNVNGKNTKSNLKLSNKDLMKIWLLNFYFSLFLSFIYTYLKVAFTIYLNLALNRLLKDDN